MEDATTKPLVSLATQGAPPGRRRFGYVDNLKVVLVIGVIVGHATLAWTGVGVWVFDEPHVREPLLSVLTLASVVGALFAIPLFFLLAGMFTPTSLARKGTGRFVIDRTLRLGIPMLFFIIFLSPIVEYVDPDNADWDQGFGPFITFIWWPPAPGPTWFLGVLLLFSVVYAVFRAFHPRRPTGGSRPRVSQLATAAAMIALASYVIRLAIPLGVEVWRLALGQAPAWAVGFALGVAGAECGWQFPLDPGIGKLVRRTAWTSAIACVGFIAVAMATGGDIDDFAGGGTWQSLITAALEGVIVVSVSLWLIDLFQRRFDHQSSTAVGMARSAYAAFVLHQVVLVGLVLATRLVPWPPEVEYLSVAVAGVAASFGLAALLLRVPWLDVALGASHTS